MRNSILVGSLVVAITATTAHAGGIVLESYTQGRPANADTYTIPMINVMAKSGFDAGSSVARKFENDVSRPAVVKQGLPLDYDRQLAAAMQVAIGGNFHAAVSAITPLIDLAHANPGAFVSHAASLQSVQKAMVFLAISQNGDGDHSAALTTFAEVMRSFPTERVSAGTYGQAANKLFEEAKAAGQGRGRLVVTSANPNGVIWIDEAFGAVQKHTRDNLLPGEYRVFVQTASSVSRVHTATVVANQDTALTIDGEFDQVVETTDYVGLKFPSDDVRDKLEPDAAAKFGNAITADQIVVIGIETIQGVPSVAGSLISKTSGKRLRGGSIPLPSASPDQLKQLALYVIGQGAPGGGIHVLDEPMLDTANPKPHEDPPIDRGAPATAAHRWGGWKWLTSVGALGAIGAGGYLLSENGNCAVAKPAGTACADVYNTATPGWILVGGGAVLAATAIYLFVTEGDRTAPTRGAFVVPTSGGAMAGYSLRF